MGYDFFRFLGERLGSPVSSKLIYLFLAYQVIVSALVFLFDIGFPPLLVLIGWILFMFLLGSRILHTRKIYNREERKDREQEQLRLQRISRLKKRLEADPSFQTRCRDCGNYALDEDSCRVQAGAGQMQFRFRSDDIQSFCLLWSPHGEDDSRAH